MGGGRGPRAHLMPVWVHHHVLPCCRASHRGADAAGGAHAGTIPPWPGPCWGPAPGRRRPRRRGTPCEHAGTNGVAAVPMLQGAIARCNVAVAPGAGLRGRLGWAIGGTAAAPWAGSPPGARPVPSRSSSSGRRGMGCPASHHRGRLACGTRGDAQPDGAVVHIAASLVKERSGSSGRTWPAERRATIGVRRATFIGGGPDRCRGAT